MFLPLRTIPLLQLKVPRMSGRPGALPLQDYKHDRPNNRDEVQWQIHKIPNNRRRRKLLEGLLGQPPQLAHNVTATLDLPSLADKVGRIFGHQHAIERVNQSVLDEESLAQDGDEGRRLGQDEQGGADGSQWARGEGHHGHLRQIGEGEHESGDAEA